MKISYYWLKEYLNINLPIQQLVDVLTNIGLEVVKVEEFSSIKGGLEGLLIGRVISCQKHPNADRLFLTKVDIGEESPLSIVCGAPNVAENIKVIVAKVGAKFYIEQQCFAIKKTKIRGIVSEGMICSETEIGVGKDKSGILILPNNAKIGESAKEYFNVTQDTIIEIDLTPNRIDAASHIGVARDLAAYMQNDAIRYKKPSVAAFCIDETTDPLKVEVKNINACPRYAGLCFKNIKIKSSPTWLKNRLKAIGLNPINNVVDITNFLLFETGQPLHAFDRDKIYGNKIIVQTLPKNTKFTTLDEVNRLLDENDLMICDAQEPMCFAGVLGGINSGITENTSSIFLESAYFDPVYNRKTARRHNLFTEASYRFERGIDINMTTYALKRAAILLKKLAGATISSSLIDIYPKPFKNSLVHLSLSYVEKLTGVKIPIKQLKKILEYLEFSIIKEEDTFLEVGVPSYRVDVKRPADVVEEVLRIYGYNNIPLKQKLNTSLVFSDENDDNLVEEKVASYLTGNGYFEIVNNSLSKASYFTLINYPIANIAMLNNPISNDLNALRQTLLFGGLENIAYNQNRQSKNLKFFEFGYVYHSNLNISNMKIVDNFEENKLLGLFLTGNNITKNWQKEAEPLNLFILKSHIHNILAIFNISIQAIDMKPLHSAMFSEGLAYKNKDEILVQVGLVHKNILNDLSIDGEVYYAEIYWKKLIAAGKFKDIITTCLPKYPYVVRDLALLLSKNIPYRSIENKAYKILPNVLKKVELFDVYEGKNIDKDKKSYAISFVLQDMSKTLTDKRIDSMMSKLITTFKQEFQATVR